ncbi:hypothetical protein B0A55_07388, partial [Friedmanniomyces simplex]
RAAQQHRILLPLYAIGSVRQAADVFHTLHFEVRRWIISCFWTEVRLSVVVDAERVCRTHQTRQDYEPKLPLFSRRAGVIQRRECQQIDRDDASGMAWEWELELELELEKLVERVVEAVAFCGTHGFDSAKLREVVVSYRIALLNNGAQQTASNDASFDANVVNEELLDAIRERLEKHPNIEVRSGEHIEGLQREPRDSNHHVVEKVDTEAPAHEAGTPRKRLFATKERMWLTITGHDSDKASVPQLEFDCLSVIAAHGPGGVVQGRLTRLTGQDKQSVPRRTDHLAAKGYILKTAVLDRGHETSLLRLKKFVEAARVSHDDPSRPVVTRDPRGNLSVDLAPLLAQTVDLMIQQPDHVMALQDLGR